LLTMYGRKCLNCFFNFYAVKTEKSGHISAVIFESKEKQT
jgi:hypothetical protein